MLSPGSSGRPRFTGLMLAANESSRRGEAGQLVGVRTGRGMPGGLAWGGGVSERRPGKHGDGDVDGDVEGVVAERPPVAVAWVEGGWLTGPVVQHVRKKRRRHPRRVAL